MCFAKPSQTNHVYVSKAARDAFKYTRMLLLMVQGRGYYSYNNFPVAPGVRSDASRSREYTGGGFLSQCGRALYWRYGPHAARKPIDYLEGDTGVKMTESWVCRIPSAIVGQLLSTVEAAIMGTPSSSGSSNHRGRSARGSSRFRSLCLCRGAFGQLLAFGSHSLLDVTTLSSATTCPVLLPCDPVTAL